MCLYLHFADILADTYNRLNINTSKIEQNNLNDSN